MPATLMARASITASIVTDNFRLYAQASREEGDRYTKDYDISIGGKLLF